MPRFLTSTAAVLLTASGFAGPPSTPGPKVGQAKSEGISIIDGLLTLDLDQRFRFEARSNFRDFNDSINDDNDDAWLLSRSRIGLALTPTQWLKLYAQMQDTREWDSDRPNTPGVRGDEGSDNFDLRQAYAEVADYSRFPLGLTAGRQRLSYGDQRLVGDSRWGNFGRTFDAVKLRWQPDKTQWLDLFAARPVQIKEEVFNDSDSEDNFFGAYYATDALLKWQTTEVYVLYRDKTDNQPDLDPVNTIDPRGAWNGPAQRITTIGTRWKSKSGALNGWDYSFEGAYQWGDIWASDRRTPALDHRAFGLHLGGGYTWESRAWKPRIGVGYNFASGDDDPNDRESGSFQNLYPANHGKFGEADPIGWRNLHNVQVRLSARPAKRVEVEIAYHANWLADTSDYWYRGNGISTQRTRTPDGRDVRTVGASNFTGHEVDVLLRWKVNDWLSFDAGYSHFFAGDYLADTGASDDADFAYLQGTIAL